MPLSFILVEPARPANVGAAARAIKTMGFSELILINSELHLSDEASWVAHGAHDILANAKCYESLEQLRTEFDLLIGSTARERGRPKTYLTPADLSLTIADRINNKVGIVFGRESSGLTNLELDLCDLYTYVPLNQAYPSLNLAQAVMVYSYELSKVSHQIGLSQPIADEFQLQALKKKAGNLLDTLNLSEQDKLRPWLMDSLSQLKSRDCKMAHQLINDLLVRFAK